ncbi:hypothetical protein D1AOALGA4SA_4956 [Olavius algarvensis Delta 1 endosymbiont]|nr:hypothetical protein D1AOALGA4SA_4956 [Olavius algarvensis Delta 1 endosymbiont]
MDDSYSRSANELFDVLDLNRDGQITRSELHTAAKHLGWHWQEAPILALLDLLAIKAPIPRDEFTGIIQQVKNDPMGPYGDVLLKSPHFFEKSPSEIARPRTHPPPLAGAPHHRPHQPQDHKSGNNLLNLLKQYAGQAVADDYRQWCNAFDVCSLYPARAALLIIDPQRSFTNGSWMQSIGDGAARDVAPIVNAFNACADTLKPLYGRMEVMFTRCPFPPGSYDWDDSLTDIIDRQQLYFIKPGNSVMFPPFNGFREWTARCIEQGIDTLVLGGCTLTSCVRVSAIEATAYFKNQDLRVVVDLNLCGARLRNFVPSPSYGGVSGVASAVRQMASSGVQVVPWVEWKRS